MSKKDIFNAYEKRIIVEIMNLLIPANEEIMAAGDMGLYDELEILFFESKVYTKAIIRILDTIKLDTHSRVSGSFFSLSKDKKIEILKSLEKNIYDEFNILKESVFSTYYRNEEVIKKIGWDENFLNKNSFETYEWDENILNKVKKIKPFWKKI